MSRIVYLNGTYLPETEAHISIFDRGFLFADAVYEVTSVLGGKLIDFDGHWRRLERSLSELNIKNPTTYDEMLTIHRKLVTENAIEDGRIYLQISRGNEGDRDFVYDIEKTSPTVVLFTQATPGILDAPSALEGIKVITIDDMRWHRRDIKTTQLLYPSMGKMMALEAGAKDAWMVEDGYVTEGTSNNAYIVKGRQIITRALSHDILAGITRDAVLRVAREAQMEVVERAFTVEEALTADEAFLTSATTFVQAVIDIDGTSIGSGIPGPVTKRLRDIYLDESQKAAI